MKSTTRQALNTVIHKLAANSQNGFLPKLLTVHVKLRMHHWNTESYAQHMALGSAYDSLGTLMDDFMETFIGSSSRELLKEVGAISVGLDEDPVAVLTELEAICRNDIPKAVPETETALLNIRDEILGLAQKTKYLLTLK